MDLTQIPTGSLRGVIVDSPTSRLANDRSHSMSIHNTASRTATDERRRLVAQVVSAAKSLPGLRTERFSTERAVAQFLLEALNKEIQFPNIVDRRWDFRAICQDAARELVSQGDMLFETSFREQTSAEVPQASTIEKSQAVAKLQAQPPTTHAPSSIPAIKIEHSDEDGPVDLNNDAVKKFWVNMVVSKYKELGLSATVRRFLGRFEAQVYVCNAMTGRIQLPVFKYHDSWTALSILCREAFEELVLRGRITFPTRPGEQMFERAKPVSKSSHKKKSVTTKDKISKKADKLTKDTMDKWMECLLNSVTSQVPLASRPRTFFDREAALNFLVNSVHVKFQLPSLAGHDRAELSWGRLCQSALDKLKIQGHIDFPTNTEIRANDCPMPSKAVNKAADGPECSPEDTKWVEAYKSGWNDGHQRGRSEGYQAGRADALAEAMQQLLQKQHVHGQDDQGTIHAHNVVVPLSAQQMSNGGIKAEHQTTEAIKLASGPFTAGVSSRQSSTGAKIFNDLANTNRYRSPAIESLSSDEGSMSPFSQHRRLEPPYPNHTVFQNATGFAAYSSGQASFGRPYPSRFAQTPRGLSVLASDAGQGAFKQPDSTPRKRSLKEVDGSTQAIPQTQKKILR